jgi:hypothetical protein
MCRFNLLITANQVLRLALRFSFTPPSLSQAVHPFIRLLAMAGRRFVIAISQRARIVVQPVKNYYPNNRRLVPILIDLPGHHNCH